MFSLGFHPKPAVGALPLPHGSSLSLRRFWLRNFPVSKSAAKSPIPFPSSLMSTSPPIPPPALPPNVPGKLTDLEIKDAHLIFGSVWADLEADFGREKLRFPKEIILLGVEGVSKQEAPTTYAKCEEYYAKFIAPEAQREIYVRPALNADLSARTIYGLVYIQAFRDAGDYLDRGELVCVFPEGQITRTGTLLPFQRGMERIAKGRSTPIIPISPRGAATSGCRDPVPSRSLETRRIAGLPRAGCARRPRNRIRPD